MSRIFGSKFDSKWVSDVSQEAAFAYLQAAQTTMHQDRARGLAALNDLFCTGAVPAPALDGRYAGDLLALDVAPLLTPIVQGLACWWMPWQGKIFDANRTQGINIFTRDSYRLAHLFWPFYRHYQADSIRTYRAFAFHTWTGRGLLDPNVTVLKIDYDLPENPVLNVRRVLDEVVQIADGLYLGKAHLRWWWGKWQTVAYFTLRH
jgi:hypothetical protein